MKCGLSGYQTNKLVSVFANWIYISQKYRFYDVEKIPTRERKNQKHHCDEFSTYSLDNIEYILLQYGTQTIRTNGSVTGVYLRIFDRGGREI